MIRSTIIHCGAWCAVILTSAVAFGQPRPSGQEPKGTPGEAAKNDKSGALLEVRFTDNSVMKLGIRDEFVDFTTQYGKLKIPVKDIERIDFGLRVPEDMKARIEAAIADLGAPDFKRREAASKILLELREKAYPFVVKATDSSDSEVANRAEELVKKFKDTIPAEMLKTRDQDIIQTASSKIAGRIDASTLKAMSNQFGEVQVRLADVFVMSSKATSAEVDTSNVQFGPAHVYEYSNRIGQTFTFKVTGNVAAGSVWGTDVYTTDSALAAVVVHTGLLKNGETGVIKVSIIPSPNAFVGSVRNGVSSSAYNQYPAAYRVHK
jgi:LCCL domain